MADWIKNLALPKGTDLALWWIGLLSFTALVATPPTTSEKIVLALGGALGGFIGGVKYQQNQAAEAGK
jgi:hypothetical protein